jgi:hypothetical protein
MSRVGSHGRYGNTHNLGNYCETSPGTSRIRQV